MTSSKSTLAVLALRWTGFAGCRALHKPSRPEQAVDILVTATASASISISKAMSDERYRDATLIKIAGTMISRVSQTMVRSDLAPHQCLPWQVMVARRQAHLAATEAGEERSRPGFARMRRAKLIADLFSGVGTFALRMAAFAKVDAYDLDEAALQACESRARGRHASSHSRTA